MYNYQPSVTDLVTWKILDNARHVEQFNELKDIMASGKFHHATHRYDGCLSGLWIYTKATEAEGGFRGFKLSGKIDNDSIFADAAHQMISQTGYSTGYYGGG